jgi:cytochrome c554/c'-like protein
VRDPSTNAQLRSLHGKKIGELRMRRDQLLSVRPAPPPDRSYVSYRFIELSDEKPSDAAVANTIARYEGEVAQLNLAWAKEHGRDCPKPAAGQPSVVGGDACAECHEEAAAVWQKTGHSHAYRTLAEKNRQYDLDCVRCHVTGYNQPGGVCRVDKSEGRADVRCEACHGPGSTHAADPTDSNIIAKPTEATCRGCHTPENSPNFALSIYLPRVLGPGHGLPSPGREKGKASGKR